MLESNGCRYLGTYLPWHMAGWCRQHTWDHRLAWSHQGRLAWLSPQPRPSSPHLYTQLCEKKILVIQIGKRFITTERIHKHFLFCLGAYCTNKSRYHQVRYLHLEIFIHSGTDTHSNFKCVGHLCTYVRILATKIPFSTCLQ